LYHEQLFRDFRAVILSGLAFSLTMETEWKTIEYKKSKRKSSKNISKKDTYLLHNDGDKVLSYRDAVSLSPPKAVILESGVTKLNSAPKPLDLDRLISLVCFKSVVSILFAIQLIH
jgi:hypothetical protein